MGKLRVLSGREACRILERNQLVEVRRRSSHIVMQRRTVDSTDSTITVPVPDHKEVRIGTLRSMIRQSGVSRSEFEE